MSHGLLSLAIAAIAFCGSHVVLSSTWLRGALRDQLGERGFLAVYSLIALVTFAWLLVAYSHAPTLPLWPRERWMALVPVVVMPLATVLLIAGYTTPNPTTVGMERFARADDPAPGVLRVTRHPVMWAIGLWAVSHVIANGDLRSLLLFGAFAALSLGGTVLIDRKKNSLSAATGRGSPKSPRTCPLPRWPPAAPGCAGATSACCGLSPVCCSTRSFITVTPSSPVLRW